MPYTKKERRKQMRDYLEFEPTGGDWVEIFYSEMVKLWEDVPRFKTYYFLKMGVLNDAWKWDEFNLRYKKFVDDINNFRHAQNCSHSDYNTALPIALDELKRRYVDAYEDKKLKENGDVD